MICSLEMGGSWHRGLILCLLVSVAAASTADVNWDCIPDLIGDAPHTTLSVTFDGQAPSTVLAGDVFSLVLTPHQLTVPSSLAGFPLSNIRGIKFNIPVPAGSSFRSASLSGWNSGVSTVSQANGVVTVTVPGPVSAAAAVQFPVLHLSLTATSPPTSSIIYNTGGNGITASALKFTASLQIGPGPVTDELTTCVPKTTAVLTSTKITSPRDPPPTTGYSPALAGSGNRTIAASSGINGAISYTWWDLGGGSTGWRELDNGGGQVFDATPGAALVSGGQYAFLLGRTIDDTVQLNQGTPGGGPWVGWQSMHVSSKVGPTATSCGSRTLAVVTATDGRILHDWWDLGGGGHGFSEIPGSLHTNLSTAASLVQNGGYAFVLAAGPGGFVWMNQGSPGGTWIGWRNTAQSTKLAPSASSSGDRTMAVITAPDGRVLYDWWDLGGGGHGFREIPGLRTNSSTAVSLVGNGRYAFVMTKDNVGRFWLNQGDPTTGAWVGWA
jgi:hypothetical protein